MKLLLRPLLIINYLLFTCSYVQAINLVINNNSDQVINSSVSYDVVTTGSTTNGKLTVSSGGKLNANIFRVGFNGGSGEVNVIDGGKIIINSSAFTYPFGIGSSGDGNGSPSTGILNISGVGSEVSSTSSSGEFSVGNNGSEGYLNITDGGKLLINQGLWLGSRGSDTTKGFVTVQGNNSELSTNGRFIVGTWNYGSAIISDGAKLVTNDLGAGAITIGNQNDNQNDNQKDNLLRITGNNTTATAVNGGIRVGNAGKGTLVVADGAVLSSAQEIMIASASTANGELAIGSRKGEQATGAGAINTDTIRFGAGKGVLVFNHTDNDYILGANILGKGSVEALSGTTILTGANSYSGTTLVDSNAVLQAGALGSFSSNSSYTINTDGSLLLDGYDQTIATLNSAGLTDLSGTVAGTVLTITGNYTGQNANLVLGAKLEDDSSITDKLVINGNATGTTYVTVKNLGGHGAQTIEGIKIIEVQGTSDNNAFIQNGRIVAGAYDYTLGKGSATGLDEQSWYLTSLYSGSSSGDTYIIRPEAMAYLSNLSMANNIFNLRLHERQPERVYIDPITGQKKTTTLWLRHQYGHNQFEDSTATLASKTNRNTVQLGSDIMQWSSNDTDRFHLGIMAGYGYSHGRSESNLTKYYSHMQLKGYSAGLYGTWYQNNTDKTGLYVDSWALWNHFTAKVNGQSLTQEKYHLKGITSSLEIGYTLGIKQIRQDYDLQLQPQAQVIWQDVKADKHIENNGTIVKANKGNIQTRLGAKAMLVHMQSRSIIPMATPYLELNWLHNTKNYGVNMSDEKVSQAGTKNIAEIKAGIEGNITDNTRLWLNVGHQFGHDSYKDTSTTIGIKYNF